MGSKVRQYIAKIGRGEDMEESLSGYIEQSMQIHNDHARLKLMMEYYTFYEMKEEGINSYMDDAKDCTDRLNAVIRKLSGGPAGLTEEAREELEQEIVSLRREVTERMQVVTAYIDRFVVYEYILNRIQYRFDDPETMPEDEVFIQDVLNFIFATKDNVVINDNIRSVLGQLPMRMTRKRYFDLVRENLSVYQDGDVSALEGFLYMFRTSAMLYQTPAMDQYFTEFIPVLKEFAALDHEKMGVKLYQIYSEKLFQASSKLHEISDVYVLLQQLINGVYAILITAPYLKGEQGLAAADAVIFGINRLFTEPVKESAEDALAELLGYFPQIEGEQEKCLEQMTEADAALEGVRESVQNTADISDAGAALARLEDLMQLASGSEFVELGSREEEEKVTPEMVEHAAGELVGELKESFRDKSRMLRRAVMANTLDKLPVFFGTAQEVADYISMSLSLCDDEAEKYVSKQLIYEMME